MLLFLRRPDTDTAVSSENVAQQEKQATEMVLRGETMGTTYIVKLIPQNAADAQTWHTLQADIDARLNDINELMSTYRPQSDISKLNRSTKNGPQQLKKNSLRWFVRQSKQAAPQGALLILRLDRSSSYGVSIRVSLAWSLRPRLRIEALKAFTGLDKISLTDNSFQKTDGRVQINLSGIAKGYGVDAIGQLLQEAGVANFMVEIGGENFSEGCE